MKFEQTSIGVLGGGQLGRMMLPPANYLNISISCLDPNPKAPCAELANQFTVGNFNDYDTVLEFGKNHDLLTIEIESVNVNALKKLQEQGKTVYPQPEVIELIQDKRVQKQFYIDHAIPTSPFQLIDNKEELKQVDPDFFPVFQKLGKGGYDGGGVQRINSPDEYEKGFDDLSLVEKAIDFEKEISVIAARNPDGAIELFPTVEMVFDPDLNLVDYLMAPADIPDEVNEKAKDIALKVTEAFGIVGLLAIELFVTKDGEVLVNECAPRPHNSGHQTIHGATVSQFEQHLRAITNLSLGKPEIIQPSAMVNILGKAGETGPANVYGLREVLAEEGVHVVFYGKHETRPHRKMGHATVLAETRKELKKKVDFIKKTLTIGT